ncbi:MAG: ribonuclease HII [Chloroflexota bacterium]|nr:ribonuclease HII [Chloroflexota bacterium]
MSGRAAPLLVSSSVVCARPAGLRQPIRRAPWAMASVDIERDLSHGGHQRIAGLDEVGRGCWAGPVYAAVVVLPPECYADRALLAEVTDSKLLTPTVRERLAADVLRLAVGAAVAWAEAPLIDRLNILGATRWAMHAALECLAGGAECTGADAGADAGVLGGSARLAGGTVIPDFILTDAVSLDNLACPQRAIIGGDRKALAIAAASIVAKVTRDADMRRRHALFPHLALASNKGYGTRAHGRALYAGGLTPLHRRSFAPMKYLLGLNDHIAGALPLPVGALPLPPGAR